VSFAAFNVVAAFAAAAPFAAEAGSSPVALSIAPARIALVAPASRRLEVSNLGAEQLVVDVAWKPVDHRTGAKPWISVIPARLVLRSRSRAFVTLRAEAGAQPGDHALQVLVAGRARERASVGMRLRLGVRVRIRAPGRLVRRLKVQGVRVRRFNRGRVLLVSVANRGNVTEQLRRLTVTLLGHGRLVSRLKAARPRELLPGAHARVLLPYAGRTRGVVTAVVELRLRGRSRPVIRRYRLRL
jgi:hypothetical protein